MSGAGVMGAGRGSRGRGDASGPQTTGTSSPETASLWHRYSFHDSDRLHAHSTQEEDTGTGGDEEVREVT